MFGIDADQILTPFYRKAGDLGQYGGNKPWSVYKDTGDFIEYYIRSIYYENRINNSVIEYGDLIDEFTLAEDPGDNRVFPQ
jgi:hypothetical protein